MDLGYKIDAPTDPKYERLLTPETESQAWLKPLLALGGTALAFVVLVGVTPSQPTTVLLSSEGEPSLAEQAPPSAKGRVFLHIADTHADPYYDFTEYWAPAAKLSRDPALYSNKEPAKTCGKFSESPEMIVAHWNGTGANAMARGGGPACPCGQYGANPPCVRRARNLLLPRAQPAEQEIMSSHLAAGTPCSPRSSLPSRRTTQSSSCGAATSPRTTSLAPTP